MKEYINLDILPEINEIVDEETIKLKNMVETYYEHNKNFYEYVLIKHQDDIAKNKAKFIPTFLDIQEEDKKFNVNIKTNSVLEARILHAQHKGTAIGIDPVILEYFEVKEASSDLGFNKYYFEPNNADIKFQNDLIYMLGAKRLVP